MIFNKEQIWNEILTIYENNEKLIEDDIQSHILSEMINSINIYTDYLSLYENYDKDRYISKEFFNKFKRRVLTLYSILSLCFC